nr:hypothetical protein RSP673_23765 [Ralstonia solanacearum P673]
MTVLIPFIEQRVSKLTNDETIKAPYQIMPTAPVLHSTKILP